MVFAQNPSSQLYTNDDRAPQPLGPSFPNGQMIATQDSSRIKPGQYSRHMPSIPPRGGSPAKFDVNQLSTPQLNEKENIPRNHDEPGSRGRSHASVPSQPLSIDPKYRLRGNSPEDSSRNGTSSKLFGSFSPTKKGLRSRSRSRSRLFGKDKTDSTRDEVSPIDYASTRTGEEIDSDFVDLLDEMQVHPDLRSKLLSLSSTVKASMLQGQATLSLAGFGEDGTTQTAGSPLKTSRKPIPELLKNRSSRPNSSLFDSPPLGPEEIDDQRDEKLAPPNTAQLFGSGPSRQASSASAGSSSSTGSDKEHSRKASVDMAQRPKLGHRGSFISLSSSSQNGTGGRVRTLSFGKEVGASFAKETPDSFATMLKCTDASRIDVARVKRMRAVVASESPAWVSAFVGTECGGYDAMIHRLDDLLNMEWRAEQHDDMLLHELLRCFVALNTTEVGLQALSSKAPRPFRQLVDLLFSEKKPGDLSTRKLIVDLLYVLLHLQLPASQSHSQSSLNYLVDLIQNPSDPAKEAVVDFIKQTHQPRPFKTYVVEMAGVCRDYFWIFCHSQNFYWRFEDLEDQIDSISGPKVPGGMTGGVEFEAMAYLTAHLKLVNSIAAVLAQYKPHQLPRPAMSATEFHQNLFASGIDRVLATLRRSSQHYYATTHLELARYLNLASRAGCKVPYHLTDWLAAPKNKAAPYLPQLELPCSLQSSASLHPGSSGAGASLMPPPLPDRESSFETRAQPASPSKSISRSNAFRSTPQSVRKPDVGTGKWLSSSPEKGSSPQIQQQSDFWNFETESSLQEAEKVPLPTSPGGSGESREGMLSSAAFDRGFDSQFFSPSTSQLHERFPNPFDKPDKPEVNREASTKPARFVPAPSTTNTNVKATAGMSHLPVPQPSAAASNNGTGSIVGSAIKKWESMSVSRPPLNSGVLRAQR